MKTILKKYFWRIGLIILGISLTVSNYFTLIENQKLDKTEKPIIVKIIRKWKLRATWVDIEYRNKIYNRIEIPNSKYWTSLDDSIPLIFDKKNDEFYVPNTSFMNKRFLIGSVLILILSLLPWTKIGNWINKKRKP